MATNWMYAGVAFLIALGLGSFLGAYINTNYFAGQSSLVTFIVVFVVTFGVYFFIVKAIGNKAEVNS